MSDYPVVGIQETIGILESGQVTPLSDIHNIEAALELIRKSEAQIVSHQELKKKREIVINQEIENLKGRIEFLKEVIGSTLIAHKQKSLTLPGLGKVNTRKKSGKWVIVDEAKLIAYLKTEEEYAKVVKTEETIQKGELNKVLDIWQSVNKLPDSVTKEPDTVGVSISFEEDVVSESSIPVAKKATSSISAE
jgi:hypothetical protein